MKFPEKEKKLFNKILKQLTKNAKKSYKENIPINAIKNITKNKEQKYQYPQLINKYVIYFKKDTNI